MFKFSGFIASLSPVLLAALLITPVRAESNFTALYSFATLAGASNIGSADDTSGFARFDEPGSVAVGWFVLTLLTLGGVRRLTARRPG